jgi:hypothetical protein
VFFYDPDGNVIEVHQIVNTWLRTTHHYE